MFVDLIVGDASSTALTLSLVDAGVLTQVETGLVAADGIVYSPIGEQGVLFLAFVGMDDTIVDTAAVEARIAALIDFSTKPLRIRAGESVEKIDDFSKTTFAEVVQIYIKRIETYLDDGAKSVGYKDIVDACSFVTSKDSTVSAASTAMFDWREAVWTAAKPQLATISGGTLILWAVVLASLPAVPAINDPKKPPAVVKKVAKLAKTVIKGLL